MKKKLAYMMLSAMAVSFVLTGCGDGSGDIGLIVKPEEEQFVTVTPQPVYAEPETDNEEQGIQLLYHTGELTEEEESAALETIQAMRQNLEVEEYLGEGIHMISSEGWMDTFAVRLVEGSRTYYLQEDGEVLLTVQVGLDIDGKAVSNVFFQDSEGKVILLKQTGRTTQLITAAVTEGEYDGAFELWQFDSETGNIRHEEGIYAAGLPVGEYTIAVKTGTAEGDVYDLWNNRENMPYTKTVLKYDDRGELIPEATPVPTPASTATPKPAATPRPAATPKPAATPAPTPEPAPQPDEDDGNDDGGSSDDGGSGGSGDSGAGGSDAGGGADVDVEWSGDIL